MFPKIAAFSLLLISAAAFAVVGKPIYSPKHQEFVNSLRKVRTATTIPIPVVVVPPPNTNRYYLQWVWPWTNSSPQWAFDIYYGSDTNATNFIADGPKFCGSTGCIVLTSNLVYGKTNWFKARLKYPGYGVTNWFYEPYSDGSGILSDFSDVSRFPPVPTPFTNYVWVGATNWPGRIFTNPIPQQQFYRMLKTTNGADLQALNSLSGQWLKIGTGTFSSWLLIDHSNNQPNLGQYMHKQ